MLTLKFENVRVRHSIVNGAPALEVWDEHGNYTVFSDAAYNAVKEEIDAMKSEMETE